MTQSRIAELNDMLRTTFMGGKVALTEGVRALSETLQSDVIQAVQSFNDFSEDNDPYGEHDFGVTRVQELQIFWKIDYYDPKLEFASENPADPTITKRVLTIMLGDEY